MNFKVPGNGSASSVEITGGKHTASCIFVKLGHAANLWPGLYNCVFVAADAKSDSAEGCKLRNEGKARREKLSNANLKGSNAPPRKCKIHPTSQSMWEYV